MSESAADQEDALAQEDDLAPPSESDVYDLVQGASAETENTVMDWVPFSERPEFQNRYMQGPGGPIPSTNPTVNQGAVTNRIQTLLELLRMAGGNPANLDVNYVQQTHGKDVAEDFFGRDLDTGEEKVSFSEGGFKGQVSPWLARVGKNDRHGVVNEFAGHTNYEQQAAFYAMDPADQERLKELMWSGGYYGSERPTFSGGLDMLDRQAFGNFQMDHNANAGTPMNVVIENAEKRNLERTLQGGEGRESVMAEINREREARKGRVIQTSDPLTVAKALKNFALDEFGMGLSNEVLDKYASSAVAGEAANTGRYYDALDALEDDTLGDINVSEIDMFLQAVSDVNNGEDGDSIVTGDAGYQFNPLAWNRIAGSLGLDPRDNSPETQQMAARVVAAQFYNSYGNDWGAAADRWHASIEDRTYSGLAAPNARRWNEHAQAATGSNRRSFSGQVLNRMVSHEEAMLERQRNSAAGRDVVIEGYDPIAQAERAMEAAYATEKQSWDFAQRGSEFFRMVAEGSRLA